MTPEQDREARNEEVFRAERARQILDDPLVAAALYDIGARIAEEWRKSPVRDVEIREKLWMMANVHENFKARLREHIETGKLASLALQRPRKFGVF